MTIPNLEKTKASSIIGTIVEGGYCIGCGACAASPSSPFVINMDEYGCLRAELDPDCNDLKQAEEEAALEVCPFSGHGPDEDEFGHELYGKDDECQKHERIGFHRATYAGHVTEHGYRERGSSGGMGSWILSELLRLDEIDAVIHVGAASSKDKGRLFEFKISRTHEEINARAKSRYYPVEMSQVLHEVFERPERYALVGLPCFIKAFRLLARQNPTIHERVPYTLAIVCGHLKSTRFADLFSWQCDIQPGNLRAIDFRKKIDGQPASQYGIEVKGLSDDKEIVALKSNTEYYGGNWGHGFFKYSACDYCDDVLGETADVAVGDAWLPGYVEDWKGTNIIVVRNLRIDEIIRKGIREDRLQLDAIDADTIAASQEGGLRHRREGLAYRLLLKDQAGSWRPQKRVEAHEDHLTKKQKNIFRLRIDLAAMSHVAFAKALEAGRFEDFIALLKPLLKQYDALFAPPLLKRIRWVISRSIKAILALLFTDKKS
ncbi:MAG: Coenzyme F420 hydrogenase/dehydrogenase, beta subunit C-terminal domain [Nitrospirae bacterium]|nr:Coenzyme F420 hydrogenase/dehydrogenase, beta subunit C-terminal domain [Nitrospirota bacterium]